MNKEDILARNKESNVPDEGVQHIENKGRRYGVIGFCCLFILLMVYNFFNGLPNYQILSLFWAYLAAESFGKYRLQKQGVLLFTTIMCIIASLGFLASYIIRTLK